MNFYQAYPWVLPTFLALGSVGFALVVWANVERQNVRRIATVSALVLALVVGAVAVPQIYSGICDYCWWCLECYLPF